MRYYTLIALGLAACGQQNHTRVIHEYEPMPEQSPAPSCSVSEEGLLTCPDGSIYQVPAGPAGIDGKQGEPGEAGVAGRDGVDGMAGTDGQDGIDGQDGTAGTNGTNGVDGAGWVVVDPCGDGSGLDEVLLKLGNVVLRENTRSVGGGNTKEYMTQLTAGSYTTKDVQACVFSVAADGTVTW